MEHGLGTDYCGFSCVKLLGVVDKRFLFLFPTVIGLFSYEDFSKMIFWLVLKLEISYYRVIIS